MKWFKKRSGQERVQRQRHSDDGGAVIIVAVGLIALLTVINLGTWFVGDFFAGAQAGSVAFLIGWSTFALYSVKTQGTERVRLLPSFETWLKFAAPIVAAGGVIWLAS
ncbi:hypothetical protein [Ensifer sp. 4252]|uniref:hypothetical protein n=1 Tax=Ensifer sp. 4252 TaxID=3373915 RepID=UPI003D24B111